MRTNRTPMTRLALDEHDLLLRSARRVLFAALLEKGISQVDLARRMDQSEAQVSRVLHSNDSMTFKTFARFCEAIGVRFEFARVEEE